MTKANANSFGRCLARYLLAFGVALFVNGTALADGLEKTFGAAGQYQVFFGDPRAYENSSAGGQWRSIDQETRLLSGRPVAKDSGAIGFSGPAGLSYFTPRLSGIGLGIGLSGKPRETTDAGELAHVAPGGRSWRLGGSVGTSKLRIGAAFGDHVDPACRETEACDTNDFWDIGVAWRFGAGAITAGYTASQYRAAGVESPETIGIFSVNAGYRITPGLDVFGGIDWIELPATEDQQEQPRNTRFMLGTNLRF